MKHLFSALFLTIGILSSFVLVNPTPIEASTEGCKVHLAVPPRCFAYQFNPDEDSGMMKEEYNQYIFPEYEFALRAEPGEGGCPSVGSDPTASCGDPRYTSYYRVAQCSPNGGWRSSEKRRLRTTGRHHVQSACVGAEAAHDSPVLVNFRARFDNQKGNFLPTRYGVQSKRVYWNYMMTQVKTGNTTFGSMYSYEDDLNWLSQTLFGLSWPQLIEQEKAGNCSMDSWDYLCAPYDGGSGEYDLNYKVACRNDNSCNWHHSPDRDENNPATFTCNSYRPSSTFSVPAADQCIPGFDPAAWCKVKLAVPPLDFATDIDSNPRAYKTKENFMKKWDRENKRYSDEDLPRYGEPGQRSCEINNHPIGIDGARCGSKSWYWAWAQCQPGGSWRPVWPHVNSPQDGRPRGSSHDGGKSCTGAWGVIGREYMVHFRNRANYVLGFNFVSRYGPHHGRRVRWNYLMGEVRSGNTTFGQEFTYEEDMDWLSRLYFGKSFEKLKQDEQEHSCPMDVWNKVCSGDYDRDDLNPVFCPGNGKCNNHHQQGLSASNPPTMTCAN